MHKEKGETMNEFTGSYYECNKCHHIWDYSDSYCPECGNQYEIELNANEVREKSRLLLISIDKYLNVKGLKLLDMLKSHDDL